MVVTRSQQNLYLMRLAPSKRRRIVYLLDLAREMVKRVSTKTCPMNRHASGYEPTTLCYDTPALM